MNTATANFCDYSTGLTKDLVLSALEVLNTNDVPDDGRRFAVVGVFVACVLYMCPETRILILSAENGLASRMVSHVRHILENHPWCVDMVPTNKKEWASGRITINRPIGIREPSVICQGIHGNITGMRADLIICDDIEVPNTTNTAQKRETLRERLRELDFILSPTGTMIYIGPPHHTHDTIYHTSDDD